MTEALEKAWKVVIERYGELAVSGSNQYWFEKGWQANEAHLREPMACGHLRANIKSKAVTTVCEDSSCVNEPHHHVVPACLACEGEKQAHKEGAKAEQKRIIDLFGKSLGEVRSILLRGEKK